MSATLYAPDGSRVRTVKNLGWLLRHWRSARVVRVVPCPDGVDDCILIVDMDPASVPGVARYETRFASARVLWDWLRRPVLDGLPLKWGTLPVLTIGAADPFPGQPVPL